MAEKWKTEDMPDQSGRTAVVTGANGGLGSVIARELARRGAQVTLACRDVARGEAAAKQIRGEVPGAQLEVESLDLASLSSVRGFADRFGARHERLDLLFNNAGIMATPKRETADGFELQFGTNHLGHFALTGRLLGRLLAAPAPRVVTVSSSYHKIGKVDVDKLDGGRYGRWTAYGRSKLANLLFALELERRAHAAGVSLHSMAAHPGYAATNLQLAGLGFAPARLVMAGVNKVFAQSPDMGALPMLYAATVATLPGGTFVGPGSWTGHHGYPKPVEPSGRAQETDNAERLWRASEKLTGVRYDFAAAAKGPAKARARSAAA